MSVMDGVIYNHASKRIKQAQFSAKTKQELQQMIDAWKQEKFKQLHHQHRILTDNFMGYALEIDHPVLQATGQLHTLDSKKLIVR